MSVPAAFPLPDIYFVRVFYGHPSHSFLQTNSNQLYKKLSVFAFGKHFPPTVAAGGHTQELSAVPRMKIQQNLPDTSKRIPRSPGLSGRGLSRTYRYLFRRGLSSERNQLSGKSGKPLTATQANNSIRTECGASDGPASPALFPFSQSSAFPFHRKKPTGQPPHPGHLHVPSA